MRFIQIEGLEDELRQVVSGHSSAKEFLNLTATDATLFAGFARTLLEEGDLDGAEAAVEISLVANGHYHTAKVLLAEIHLKKKQEKKALEILHSALEVNPPDKLAWLLMGKIRLALFDYIGAAQALKKSLQLPGDASTTRKLHVLIAETYLKLQRQCA